MAEVHQEVVEGIKKDMNRTQPMPMKFLDQKKRGIVVDGRSEISYNDAGEHEEKPAPERKRSTGKTNRAGPNQL
jgi:hypothetical protein